MSLAEMRRIAIKKINKKVKLILLTPIPENQLNLIQILIFVQEKTVETFWFTENVTQQLLSSENPEEKLR